jgi:hypothetical protein
MTPEFLDTSGVFDYGGGNLIERRFRNFKLMTFVVTVIVFLNNLSQTFKVSAATGPSSTVGNGRGLVMNADRGSFNLKRINLSSN